MPIGQLASLSNSPWMRGAPQSGFSRLILRINSRHVFRNRWSAKLAVTDSPSPEQPATLAVPVNDGIRLNDDQGRSPIVPNVAQPHSTGVARPDDVILGASPNDGGR